MKIWALHNGERRQKNRAQLLNSRLLHAKEPVIPLAS